MAKFRIIQDALDTADRIRALGIPTEAMSDVQIDYLSLASEVERLKDELATARSDTSDKS